MSDTIHLMPLSERRGKGLEALLAALGPANAPRFLAALVGGEGDYTAERGSSLQGVTLEQVKEDLVTLREANGT